MRFVLGYAIAGATWILLTGEIVHQLVKDRDLANLAENLKGWVFIMVTALLLGQTLGHYFKIIRRSARLLQQSEARLRFLSDNLPNSYVYEFERTEEGAPVFSFISAGVERIHGLTPREVLQDGSLLFAQLDARQAALCLELERQSARDLSDFEVDLRIRRSDATERLIHLRSRPIRQSEGKTHWDGFAIDITQQTQAYEALRQSEKLLREMEQTAKIGGWDLDPASGLGRWSEGVAQIHDLDPKVTPSRELSLSCYVGESRARLEQALAEAVAQGTPYDLELEFVSMKGVRKWVRTICQPVVKDGKIIELHGSLQDISERKQTEEALRQSEESFRAMFELASIGIAQTDPFTARFLRVNKKFMEITGYSEPELFAMRIPDLTHPEDRQASQAAFDRLVSGETQSYRTEKRLTRKDHSIAWVNVNATLIRDSSGQPLRTLASIEDITESKRLEAHLRQTQKMEAIGQLAGGVAHDFNNILCAMRIQTELAETAENIPENIREDLREIRSAAERAANLTRQLLLFSRKQIIQPRSLDLNETVANMAKMLQRIIGEDIELKLQLHEVPMMINADPGMLDQVLMNLAVNARDAMPGGGTLCLKTAHNVLSREVSRMFPEASPGHYVLLCVSDTGCGMSQEVQSRIFEPFFTTKAAGQGTGLGLATVFGIVRQHHGWITVESEVGRGSCFQIFLPAVDRPSASDFSPDAAATKPRRGTETILVAEDDRPMRVTTRTLLERNGYKVLEATNGVEAIEVWKANRAKIKLLLTDLVMPGGMSGQQLVDQLRKEDSQLKFVFSTGYSPESLGGEIPLKIGRNFLPKPFTAAMLLDTVRACLDDERVPAEKSA